MMRARVYVRVSTEDQTTEQQRSECLRLVTARGWELEQVTEEQESAQGARPLFKRLIEDAHRGHFQILVIWALDRLARSMWVMPETVLKLERYGVRVVSVCETWLDQEMGPTRDLLIAFFSYLADHERRRISDRTKSALAERKAKGVRLGRPRKRIEWIEVDDLIARGTPLERIARRLSVAPSTLRRAIANRRVHAERLDAETRESAELATLACATDRPPPPDLYDFVPKE